MILTRAADAYRNLNNYEEAKKNYEKALNNEFDAYAVLGMAILSKNHNKYDEAIISLNHLIQQDTKNYRFYIELSDCYLKKGDRTSAVQILEDFLKLGIKNQKISEILSNL